MNITSKGDEHLKIDYDQHCWIVLMIILISYLCMYVWSLISRDSGETVILSGVQVYIHKEVSIFAGSNMIGTQNRARTEYLFIMIQIHPPENSWVREEQSFLLTHNFCRCAYGMLFLGVQVHNLKLNSFDVGIKVSFTFRLILSSLFTKLYIVCLYFSFQCFIIDSNFKTVWIVSLFFFFL